MNKKEGLNWLTSQPVEIRANLKMIQTDQQLFRIDQFEQTTFKARVPLNPQKNENTTIPRVCCSFSFWDAVIGYDPERLVEEKGTHFIHRVAHDFYFIPTENLTPFANLSKEVWVIENNKEVSLQKVAEFTVKFIKGTFLFFIKNELDDLPLNKNTKISKGDFTLEVTPKTGMFIVRKSLLKISKASKIIEWK